MEVMKVYNEAMATWIIARVTSGKCEGADFVFGLIESAILISADGFYECDGIVTFD